jgi:hypothetical protein
MKNEEARKLGQQSEEQHHKQAELDFSQSFFARDQTQKRKKERKKNMKWI